MDVHNCVGFILLYSNICWWSQEGTNSDMHQVQDLANNSENIFLWFKMFLYFLIYICTDFYSIKFNILITLSLYFGGTKYMYIIVQFSPSFISRIFLLPNLWLCPH